MNNNPQNISNQEFISLCFKGEKRKIKPLLEQGLNPNFAGLGGFTPLIASLLYNHFETAKLLIEFGADVDYTNQKSNLFVQSPLSNACHNGNVKAVRFLLEHNANINHYTTLHGTPLVASIKNGHFNICELLIDAGADIELKSPVGLYNTPTDTPLCWAVKHNRADAVELLLKNGAKTKPINQLPKQKMSSKIKQLLKNHD